MELHQQVLSFTSARDAARYRRVCKKTNQLVVRSQKFLLRAYAGGALSRLKTDVDEFNSLEAPHDADSLVKALHVWTKRRGHFADYNSFMGSVVKLMAHFFMKKGFNDQKNNGNDRMTPWERGLTDARWAFVAKTFAIMLSRPSEEWGMDRHLSDLAMTEVLDDNERDKLFEYAKDPQNLIIVREPLSDRFEKRSSAKKRSAMGPKLLLAVYVVCRMVSFWCVQKHLTSMESANDPIWQLMIFSQCHLVRSWAEQRHRSTCAYNIACILITEVR